MSPIYKASVRMIDTVGKEEADELGVEFGKTWLACVVENQNGVNHFRYACYSYTREREILTLRLEGCR